MAIVYLDASALVKLVLAERESAALQSWLADRPDRASSVVSRVEVPRAIRRSRPEDEALALSRAELVLAKLVLVDVDTVIVRRAAQLDPPALRVIDAIHLASALSLPELEGIVTYDARLAEAARLAGVAVHAPGAAT